MSRGFTNYLTRTLRVLYKTGMDYKKLLATYAKRRERAKAMRLAGLSALEIAKRLGISRQRVYQIIK